jgi:hypothetical protein
VASAWSSNTSYTAGTLVTYNNSIFLAVADNTNIVPNSSSASGVWSGVTLGTGANPAGIPFNISPHTLSSSATVYLGPTSGGSSTSASPTNSAIAPASCTPSMTIYSYGPTNSITYSLMYVTPNSSSSSWAIGSSIMSCTISTGSSSGGVQSCSVTAASAVSAGSVLTISAPAQTSASGNTGAFVGFSCY